jgi:hypothetical protein
MSEEYEGSLILEQLTEHGLVDDFLEAIDSDDINKVVSILRKAGVEDSTIKLVLEEIQSN